MNHDELTYAKSMLRLRRRAARRAITPEMREDAALTLVPLVLSVPQIRTARAVLAYGAMSEELDLDPCMAALRKLGIRIALPRIAGLRELELHWEPDDHALATGPLGLHEPFPDAPVADPTLIDAVLTPGVAFDAEGWRLGMGSGYYDVLFTRLDSAIPRIGIAFDEQIACGVPHEDNDQPMDMVITPTRILHAERLSPTIVL